jgi:hypothetical protein
MPNIDHFFREIPSAHGCFWKPLGSDWAHDRKWHPKAPDEETEWSCWARDLIERYGAKDYQRAIASLRGKLKQQPWDKDTPQGKWYSEDAITIVREILRLRGQKLMGPPDTSSRRPRSSAGRKQQRTA